MTNEKDCFVFYYNKYKDKIYSYFWFRVNFDQKTAEDLTSEVFIKALKNFEKFDVTRSFQAWIYAISRNHLINYYKASKRETSLAEAEGIVKLFHTQVDEKLELEEVIKVINSMEGNYKEIILLRFIEGLTNQEIAQLLGKEEGAVRTQISRSMSKLRELLKNKYE